MFSRAKYRAKSLASFGACYFERLTGEEVIKEWLFSMDLASRSRHKEGVKIWDPAGTENWK